MSKDIANRQWEIEQQEGLFKGFYRIDKVLFKHGLFNGGMSELMDRELFLRGNVVGVLPYDPNTDQIVLVEQFRIGAINQTPNPWLLEVIAGMIEPNEIPENVAKRESFEEAGLELNSVELIGSYLASPGSTTEEVYLYYAETDLTNVGGLYGLEEEGEDIRVHVVSADDAIRMLEDGTIKNAISIIALQWFRHQRLLKK